MKKGKFKGCFIDKSSRRALIGEMEFLCSKSEYDVVMYHLK